jgi:exodeoxyribonuclease V beta subunit
MRSLDSLTVALDGLQLIEANAGTGKTFTITTLVLRLLLERHLDISQVCVVTYTNAATAELRRKLRERLRIALSGIRREPAGLDPLLRTYVDQRAAIGNPAADARRLEAALYGFDEAAIFTIHGFCQRVLQEHAFESGTRFDAELLGDDRLLLADIVNDFWVSRLYDAPPTLADQLRADRVSPERLTQLARLAVTHPDLCIVPARAADPHAAAARALEHALTTFAPDELRRRKEASGLQSFDDLLQQLDRALRGPGGTLLAEHIARRYPAVLIDEFQDTDAVQFRIFAAAHRPGGALFLIGDPKQAIYGFRGADVFAYIRAKQRCGDAAHALETNWRSSPSLVHAVNCLFSRARRPFVLAGIPYFPSTAAAGARDGLGGAAAGLAPLRILFVRRPADGKWMNRGAEKLGWFYEAVGAEIARLLAGNCRIHDRPLHAGDIAVLCRTNEQTKRLQAALVPLGIRSVLRGDASVFDTTEAEHVERVVRALADPGDMDAIAAALITSVIGLTGDALWRVRRDERAWEQWVERFRAWHDAWRASGFTAAFRRVLDDCATPARVLATTGGERCVTNILHLVELLQRAAAETRRGPLGLAEWLQRMRGDIAARQQEVADSAQIRLESDAQALQLVTIHKSKGLQYPVVICPFLWDGLLTHPNESYRCFHDPQAEHRLTLDLGMPQGPREITEREALGESVRTLYVALTRAEQLCLVVWGGFRDAATSPLGYLLHQAPDAADDDGLWMRTRDRIKQASDTELRADLDRLAIASGGSIAIAELARGPGEPLAGPTVHHPSLAARTIERAIVQRWRVASFSALTAGERALADPAAEGVDRDELADASATVEPGGDAVRGFPRGRQLGTLVHKLFETADFVTATPALLRDTAARLLPAYGLGREWADAIGAAVCDVIDTPLLGGAFALRQIAAGRRLNELEFVFPVAGAAASADATRLTAGRLAAAFAAHGTDWIRGDYARRIAALPFGPLAGFLRGYMDLVFVHDGRWYIVDYKTNDLGPRAADYRPHRLAAEMARHHYVLQYHLYAVALDRYLRQRVRDYSYARHFGGAVYLFVRGMAPVHEPGCGVFVDRPAPACIAALAAAVGEDPIGAFV